MSLPFEKSFRFTTVKGRNCQLFFHHLWVSRYKLYLSPCHWHKINIKRIININNYDMCTRSRSQPKDIVSSPQCLLLSPLMIPNYLLKVNKNQCFLILIHMSLFPFGFWNDRPSVHRSVSVSRFMCLYAVRWD